MTDISPDTIQRMWIASLVVYAVVLVVVAVLLTLILAGGPEVRVRGVDDLDDRAAGCQQHHPHRAARHDQSFAGGDPRCRPRASWPRRPRCGPTRALLRAARTACSSRSRCDECHGPAGAHLSGRSGSRCSWPWPCSCARSSSNSRTIGGPATRFVAPANFLAKIRLGVRAIERQTDALAPQVTRLNGGLRAIRDGLRAIDDQPGHADRRGRRTGSGDEPLDVPEAVYAIWWTGLIVTLVVFVPLAVYSAPSHLAVRPLDPAIRGGDAAGGRPALPATRRTSGALDATISVAGDDARLGRRRGAEARYGRHRAGRTLLVRRPPCS